MNNTDWKTRILNWRKDQEQQRLERQDYIKKVAKEGELFQQFKKLQAFQEKHRCHVCKRKSGGPKEWFIESYYDRDKGDWFGGEWEKDWETPKDGIRCLICHHWICEDDIFEEICRNCAEKLEV